MAWYVFALVDAAPSANAGKGLSGALSIRKLAGAFVVVERRADVPPVEFGSLQKHQEVVARLAKTVPAILPVRFGTLLEPEHLEEAVQERDDEIGEAFDLVRNRVQFTWRLARRKTEDRRRKTETGKRRTEDGKQTAETGTAYLRRAARAASPPPAAAFRPLRAPLSRLVAAQRYQPGTEALPEALYHLVEKKKVARYLAAAAAVTTSSPGLNLTGPFPAFAFAPEIL
jgi:hypothetical protein